MTNIDKNTFIFNANRDELWPFEICQYLGHKSKSHRTPLYRPPLWSPYLSHHPCLIIVPGGRHPLVQFVLVQCLGTQNGVRNSWCVQSFAECMCLSFCHLRALVTPKFGFLHGQLSILSYSMSLDVEHYIFYLFVGLPPGP